MLLSAISVVVGLLAAETPDTLQAVTVVADRGVVVSRTDTVHVSNSISISDAFASIPGLYVVDYGGLAGLKSVSLRGMGSPHAAIYVDGVRVGNIQSGQADLGIPNLARIIIKHGDIRKQYALSAGMGTALLMVTYLVVEYCNFGIYLPVSATMAIIALPLMAFIFMSGKRSVGK